MTLQSEILEAIDRQLPSQVGDALKKRLGELDDLQDRLARLQREYDSLCDDNEKLRESKEKWDRIVVFADKVDKREAEVTARENKMELLEYKAEAANLRAKDVFRLADTVFRGPRSIVRTTRQGQVPIAAGDYVQQCPVDVTETTRSDPD